MHTFTDIKLQNNLTPEGRGGGGFDVNISKYELAWNRVLVWCKLKGSVCLVMPGWLAEQRAVGLPVTGDLLCLGFAFLSAGVWVDSWVLSPFPGNTSLVRQRNELRTKDREHLFLEDVQDSLWNHEVAGEHRTGRRAGCDHLYLCLPYDCSHWHPTGGWVLMIICFSHCYSLQKTDKILID